MDRLERLLILISALGFGMAAIGLLGEVLGWWNDTGELLITVGTLIGVATAVVTLVVNATKGQVHRVADGVDANGAKLDTVNVKLDGLGTKLDTMDSKLGTMDSKLGTMDSKLDKLDVIQAQLDHQTGVMDRQLAVLGEIRDRL